MEKPECPICRTSGKLDYDGLEDVLFGTPGAWSICRCTNSECCLAWMSNELPQNGVAEFYRGYYTHGGGESDEVMSKSGFAMGLLGAVLLFFNRLFGIKHQRERCQQMYLDTIKPGRLLDMGCGDGTRLQRFAKMGWQVEGQEIDPEAAARATAASGAPVHCGDLRSLDLPLASYDAIVMNHVLEHVTDPGAVLRTCKTLLAPGGRLVALVPNYDSLGHRLFGRHWRGLEPPRHLFHYCPTSLACLAEHAGLSGADVSTTSAHGETFAIGSFMVAANIPARHPGRLPFTARLKAVAFQYLALVYVVFKRDQGEECALQWKALNEGEFG